MAPFSLKMEKKMYPFLSWEILGDAALLKKYGLLTERLFSVHMEYGQCYSEFSNSNIAILH